MSVQYVIMNTDNNKWLGKPGASHVYTNNILNARRFDTKAEAEADRCPENECVISITEVFNRSR